MSAPLPGKEGGSGQQEDRHEKGDGGIAFVSEEGNEDGCQAQVERHRGDFFKATRFTP